MTIPSKRDRCDSNGHPREITVIGRRLFETRDSQKGPLTFILSFENTCCAISLTLALSHAEETRGGGDVLFIVFS